jgi:hypothetical protein
MNCPGTRWHSCSGRTATTGGDGEVDFPEAVALESTATLSANMYAKGDTASGKPGPSKGFSTATVPVESGWHTATIEWSPDNVTFILDDGAVGTIADSVPDTPMHWVLQVETAIDGGKPARDVAGHCRSIGSGCTATTSDPNAKPGSTEAVRRPGRRVGSGLAPGRRTTV